MKFKLLFSILNFSKGLSKPAAFFQIFSTLPLNLSPECFTHHFRSFAFKIPPLPPPNQKETEQQDKNQNGIPKPLHEKIPL